MNDHDVIRINYVGRVKKTGEIFDLTDETVAEDEDIDTSNMDLGPVPVMLGEGYVLEGLEERIKDMEPGDERTVEVPAEDAFGNRTSDNIKTLSRREFDEYDVTPRRGMPIEIDGRRGKVLTVSNGRVKVDFNHPLAGKDLEYDVEVLEQINDPEDQVKAILDFHIAGTPDIDVEDGNATVTVHDDIDDSVMERLAEEIEKLEAIDSADVQKDVEEDQDDQDS